MGNNQIRETFMREFIFRIISETSKNVEIFSNMPDSIDKRLYPPRLRYSELKARNSLVRRPIPRQPPRKVRKKVNLSKIPDDMIKASITRRINSLLSDPYINAVECGGPDNPVLIKRSGKIQPTNMTFSKEEIENFMNQVSEQTRIPLIPGIFKARVGKLILTAVISEFVGTRFLVQRGSSQINIPEFNQHN
jgi:hypothetical protein